VQRLQVGLPGQQKQDSNPPELAVKLWGCAAQKSKPYFWSCKSLTEEQREFHLVSRAKTTFPEVL
jgi:hypothetical protein